VYKMVVLTMGHEQKQWNNKFFFNEFWYKIVFKIVIFVKTIKFVNLYILEQNWMKLSFFLIDKLSFILSFVVLVFYSWKAHIMKNTINYKKWQYTCYNLIFNPPKKKSQGKRQKSIKKMKKYFKKKRRKRKCN
jgi:hypothetical protein